MKTSRIALLCGTVLLSAGTGCFDNIFTATAKLASGQLAQLSANEVKALNALAVDIGKQQTPPLTVPTLTDPQAQAVSDFLKANNLNTTQDIQNIVTRVQNGEQLAGQAALMAAFGNTDATAFGQIFDSIGGAAP